MHFSDYLDTETAMSQERYSVVIPLTESYELSEIPNTEVSLWQFMSFVCRGVFESRPSKQQHGASPDNLLLLHKRQNHLVPVVLWIVD